jgi:response regulator RpfG family c-di-GMP phosphodiesterase
VGLLFKPTAQIFRRLSAIEAYINILMDLKKSRDREQAGIVVLVFDESLRKSLLELLQDNGYGPQVAANPQEVIKLLRKKKCATVFIDCEALSLYGPGICSKIKLGCQYCRVVLFCDKTLETHRKIIKEAMEIGIYACLLPPYEDWEILTMVSYYPRLRSS